MYAVARATALALALSLAALGCSYPVGDYVFTDTATDAVTDAGHADATIDGGAPDTANDSGPIDGTVEVLTICTPPKSACGIDCVNLQNNESHCGSCDFSCATGEVCKGGKCRGGDGG